jgi:hypothetical protein
LPAFLIPKSDLSVLPCWWMITVYSTQIQFWTHIPYQEWMTFWLIVPKGKFGANLTWWTRFSKCVFTLMMSILQQCLPHWACMNGSQCLGFNKGFGSNIWVFKVQYVEYGAEL